MTQPEARELFKTYTLEEVTVALRNYTGWSKKHCEAYATKAANKMIKGFPRDWKDLVDLTNQYYKERNII